jgi:hypothetical protein
LRGQLVRPLRRRLPLRRGLLRGRSLLRRCGGLSSRLRPPRTPAWVREELTERIAALIGAEVAAKAERGLLRTGCGEVAAVHGGRGELATGERGSPWSAARGR